MPTGPGPARSLNLIEDDVGEGIDEARPELLTIRAELTETIVLHISKAAVAARAHRGDIGLGPGSVEG